MVRRRSIGSIPYRGSTEIHLLGQVRSSLDSSRPKLRMGAVSVLGGIGEIAFRRALYRAECPDLQVLEDRFDAGLRLG